MPIVATDAEILRDQVWKDYRKDRENNLCSRCGSYTKYEIIEQTYPTAEELNTKYGYNFFIIEYSIKKTEIRHDNSLGGVEWGNICNPCRDHMLGIASHPIQSSQSDTEKEIQRLKRKETTRRLFQEDKVKAAKAAINKERRENGELPIKKHKPYTRYDANEFRDIGEKK